MSAFDTNVLVRVLTGDDPEQTLAAERAFTAAARSDGVFVSLVVFAELGWVLRGAYEWSRATIFERISRLTRTRGVVVEDLELVERALAECAVGGADLAGYLILGKARGAAGGTLVTFDRKLLDEPNTVSPQSGELGGRRP